jgi:serine/threonine-protein kinase
MIVGSPYYAAPEQIQNPEQAGPSADLYSLAVVLYRMVTGQLPEHVQGTSQQDSHLGQQWTAFLQTALALDPGQRFQDAPEMLQALQALQKDWKQKRQEICKLPEPASYTWDPGDKPLRKEPIFTGSVQNGTWANLDRLLQPKGFLGSELSSLQEGILDAATGLVWGYAVSRIPLSQLEAWEFIAGLTTGSRPWRLPTLEELLSLLQPRRSLEEVCSPPLEQLQGVFRLWSADQQTKSKGWVLDLEQGAALAQDRHCRFRVLPVQDAASSTD